MMIGADEKKRLYVTYQNLEGQVITRCFGRGSQAKVEAEAFVLSISAQYAVAETNEIPRNTNELTMLSIIGDLKKELLLNGRTERYVNDLERVVRCSGLGNKNIEKLTLNDFEWYTRFNTITRNRYMSYIKVVLNYAVRNDLIVKNPLHKWRKAKEQPRRNPLTIEDLEKIKEVAAPHLKWAIEVAQNLGVRCGKTELFSLRWIDIDYDRSYIKVFSNKTKTWRMVPFTNRFGERLKEVQTKSKTPYICEYRGGSNNIARPIERIHKSWRTALKKSGVGYYCVFYDVRHLYASELLHRGADLLSVSALLGHASTKMTADVYGHANTKSILNAVSLLEERQRTEKRSRYGIGGKAPLREG